MPHFKLLILLKIIAFRMGSASLRAPGERYAAATTVLDLVVGGDKGAGNGSLNEPWAIGLTHAWRPFSRGSSFHGQAGTVVPLSTTLFLPLPGTAVWHNERNIHSRLSNPLSLDSTIVGTVCGTIRGTNLERSAAELCQSHVLGRLLNGRCRRPGQIASSWRSRSPRPSSPSEPS